MIDTNVIQSRVGGLWKRVKRAYGDPVQWFDLILFAAAGIVLPLGYLGGHLEFEPTVVVMLQATVVVLWARIEDQDVDIDVRHIDDE